MLNMKTTIGDGGSHKESIKRASFLYKTPSNSNPNSTKDDLMLENFKKLFSQMGYEVPVLLLPCCWKYLPPKNNPDLYPPLKVFIKSDLYSFYLFNTISGALGFYRLGKTNPNYSDQFTFEKLELGGGSC